MNQVLALLSSQAFWGALFTVVAGALFVPGGVAQDVFSALSAAASNWLQRRLPAQQYSIIKAVAQVAVTAAAQEGQAYGWTNARKKQEALAGLTAAVREQGITRFSATTLDDAIEAAYNAIKSALAASSTPTTPSLPSLTTLTSNSSNPAAAQASVSYTDQGSTPSATSTPTVPMAPAAPTLPITPAAPTNAANAASSAPALSAWPATTNTGTPVATDPAQPTGSTDTSASSTAQPLNAAGTDSADSATATLVSVGDSSVGTTN